MAETALAALLRAVNARARESGAPWGNRAYFELAPLVNGALPAWPYLVYSLQGGGELNAVRARDAEFVLAIRALDESLAGALGAAAVIEQRFNDRGLYDDPASPLEAGPDWTVLTTTQERAVHLLELVDGQPIYHEGAQFRVRMQATG